MLAEDFLGAVKKKSDEIKIYIKDSSHRDNHPGRRCFFFAREFLAKWDFFLCLVLGRVTKRCLVIGEEPKRPSADWDNSTKPLPQYRRVSYIRTVFLYMNRGCYITYVSGVLIYESLFFRGVTPPVVPRITTYRGNLYRTPGTPVSTLLGRERKEGGGASG